eukprot:364615-Chlamydomonas_euryale.AAC.39
MYFGFNTYAEKATEEAPLASQLVVRPSAYRQYFLPRLHVHCCSGHVRDRVRVNSQPAALMCGRHPMPALTGGTKCAAVAAGQLRRRRRHRLQH